MSSRGVRLRLATKRQNEPSVNQKNAAAWVVAIFGYRLPALRFRCYKERDC
jgi:hypothetical protein